MTPSERVKDLCKKKGIPVYVLEKDLGFANAYIGQLKKTIPYDRAVKIAEYLDTSVEYLQTGVHPEKKSSSGKSYYFDDKAAEVAQIYFDDPNYRILFDAARGSSPENLKLAAEILEKMKRTNPDG